MTSEAHPRQIDRRPGVRPATVVLAVLATAMLVSIVVLGSTAVVSDMQMAPGVPVGTRATLDVSSPGRQFVYLANFTDSASPLPAGDPWVTITDPLGEEVVVSAVADPASGTGAAGSYRTIGQFEAPTTGSYSVASAGGSPMAGPTVSISPLDYRGVPTRVLFMGSATLVPVTLLVVAVSLTLVVVLGRAADRRRPVAVASAA